jgi:hypothetical protein
MAGSTAPPSVATAAATAVRVLLETEDRFRPDPQHGDTVQGGRLTTWMRRDLIDWMAEVQPLVATCPVAHVSRQIAPGPRH